MVILWLRTNFNDNYNDNEIHETSKKILTNSINSNFVLILKNCLLVFPA